MWILHLTVGMVIGLSSEAWLVHLLTPFFWGGLFCLYSTFYCQEEFRRFVDSAERVDPWKRKFGFHPAWMFYLLQYVPATALALVGSFGSFFLLVAIQWRG